MAMVPLMIVGFWYAKNVVVAQKGRSLVGAHHIRDAAGAQNLVRQAVGRVH